MAALPAPPSWSDGSLADVLPAAARALGVPCDSGFGGSAVEFAPAQRMVVVLVDGMGYDLLHARGGHAPFLRSQLGTAAAARVPCGFPSTTATSMGTFGTGLLPGAHGLAGYTVLDPATDRVLNELSWDDGPDPFAWQPYSTVFEVLERHGVSVTRIGPRYFDGSGLTNAALRGGRFASAWKLSDRVELALTAVRASRRSLVYLYWGELDKVGHVHGCQSWQWGEELEAVDAALSELSRRVPAGTSVVVTADHGMVDVPMDCRIELADRPDLREGVRVVAGEPRSLQLHVHPGQLDAVRQRWTAALGERAVVSTREELADRGWFGPVLEDRVGPRIGDLVVSCLGELAIVDRTVFRPEVLALLGVHGSLTPAEVAVPVIEVAPR